MVDPRDLPVTLRKAMSIADRNPTLLSWTLTIPQHR
jgi:hypothetical protein